FCVALQLPVPASPVTQAGAATVVCPSSTDAASQNRSPKLFATRKPYCRAQLNPTLYCASMVCVVASVGLSTPFLVSVTRLHIWPPVNVRPLLNFAWPQN